jgi:hypothetical protein
VERLEAEEEFTSGMKRDGRMRALREEMEIEMERKEGSWRVSVFQTVCCPLCSSPHMSSALEPGTQTKS